MGASWFKSDTNVYVRLLLIGIVVLFLTYFIGYQIRRHESFLTYLDLAATEQTIWNTSQGWVFGSTVYPPTGRIVRNFSDRITENRLGTHVQPTFLLLVPIYHLFPNPVTLLIVMGVFQMS
jgi:uncharacterized membrane protein